MAIRSGLLWAKKLSQLHSRGFNKFLNRRQKLQSRQLMEVQFYSYFINFESRQ